MNITSKRFLPIKKTDAEREKITFSIQELVISKGMDNKYISSFKKYTDKVYCKNKIIFEFVFTMWFYNKYLNSKKS